MVGESPTTKYFLYGSCTNFPKGLSSSGVFPYRTSLRASAACCAAVFSSDAAGSVAFSSVCDGPSGALPAGFWTAKARLQANVPRRSMQNSRVVLFTCLTLLPDSMADALGSSDPDVLALEIDTIDMVVRETVFKLDRFQELRVVVDPCLPAHRSLYRALGRGVAVFPGRVGRRVGHPAVGEAVDRTQTLIGARIGDRAFGFHHVDEIAGQSRVAVQVTAPVPAVVSAHAEVSRDPEDLVHIADTRGDDVDQAIIAEDVIFHFTVRVAPRSPLLLGHV